ncbi:outer membrane protein [Tianweitania sediminis]|uniref:Porin family protein n=1 Tax=Tianweitania sediminis TaxID=1502156 RepID=A0A8J7UL52_9HYPH|nr:outer membrane protein [Tianweitania sediminis]MBP0439027.1 porin family protein [Tianweitania sediminis]HEV7416731.1 outer membrane protein [Tianweitania sediminis]
MHLINKYARPAAALTGLAAIFAAFSAQAADVVMEEPPAPAFIESMPVASWAGPYAGVAASYGFNGRASGLTGPDVDTDGFAGSGFAGYNWQTGSFVYGFEGDVGYSGVEGSDGGNKVEGGLNGSIRARMGVAATDRVLIYGTAGGAAERTEVSNAFGSDDKTLLGYTVGGGVDAKLTDQVFGRVEYRYTDYGSETFNTGGLAQNVDTRDHKVSVGVGFKF